MHGYLKSLLKGVCVSKANLPSNAIVTILGFFLFLMQNLNININAMSLMHVYNKFP
jgi:hypothetical protein